MNISQLVSVLDRKCPLIKSEDFTSIWEGCGGCLTVKNQWELFAGDEGNVISGSKEKECDAMDKYMDT